MQQQPGGRSRDLGNHILNYKHKTSNGLEEEQGCELKAHPQWHASFGKAAFTPQTVFRYLNQWRIFLIQAPTRLVLP